MSFNDLDLGSNYPNEINVVIEISKIAGSVKYEIDKDTELLHVDRFLSTPMVYPFMYGYVPGTMGGDGDPIDIILIGDHELIPGSVIRAKPIGVLIMSDEKGQDEKIVVVPGAKMNSCYQDINDISELPSLALERIRYFFEHYKDLEKGKWVKVEGFEGSVKAKEILKKCIK